MGGCFIAAGLFLIISIDSRNAVATVSVSICRFVVAVWNIKDFTYFVSVVIVLMLMLMLVLLKRLGVSSWSSYSFASGLRSTVHIVHYFADIVPPSLPPTWLLLLRALLCHRCYARPAEYH